MNASELFKQDGTSAGVFYCGGCRVTYRTQTEAEECCTMRTCSVCKCVIDRYRIMCDACIAFHRAAKESERFAKSDKLTEWSGWVMVDGYGSQDGYFDSVEALIEWCDDEEVNRPKYAWTCKEIHFVNVNADSIYDDIMDAAYEDFDADDLGGTVELEAAIEAFNIENAGLVSYTPNYALAVLIPDLIHKS